MCEGEGEGAPILSEMTACASLDCIRFARCAFAFPRVRPEMRPQTAPWPAFPPMSFDLHRFEHHSTAAQSLHPIAVGCPQTMQSTRSLEISSGTTNGIVASTQEAPVAQTKQQNWNRGERRGQAIKHNR